MAKLSIAIFEACVHIQHKFSFLDHPPLLLRDLHQSLVDLLPLLLHIQLFPTLSLSLPIPLPLLPTTRQIPIHHHHARRPLRLARHTQLRPALNIDVRDVVVLAEHGDMRDYVHGRDVCGEDDDADWIGGRSGGGGGRGAPDGFDDFLDAAFQGAVGRGCGR